MVECSTALKMSKLQLGGGKMDDSHKIILTIAQAKTLYSSILLKSGIVNLLLETRES